jgi:hypothetical protein
MIRTIAAAAVLSLTMSALPAYAADDKNAGNVPPATTAPGAVADNLVWGDNLTWGANKVTRSPSRPAALPALYASYAALQAFDVYSTRQALARGAREANPLMQGVVGNTGAFVAMKAGVGIATIMAAERLWKTNKAAAIAVMVASNGVSAIVAARNARTLRQLR